MEFIIIFGPPAVGKMAVGFEIEKLTGIPLFHNHIAIEPTLRFFPFGTPSFLRIVDNFRKDVFNEVSQSNLPGLLYTLVWDIESEENRQYVEAICSIFDKSKANISFVELMASTECRLQRNKTKLRLSEKPSKRNISESEKRLLSWEGSYKLNTTEQLPFPYTHIKIDTTNLRVEETATKIIDRLGISRKA